MSLNILFLTLVPIENLGERGIYHDLIRKFCEEGNKVYTTYPLERRNGKKTNMFTNGNFSRIAIKSLNIQKTNILEKTLSTFSISWIFKRAISIQWPGVKFDLIIYSTPPITFSKIVKYYKNRDLAVTYLLLKDIFPQNAVDLGMIKENSIVHKYFLMQEKNLYNVSDHIGCMSPANVKYLNRVRPELSGKTEVNPNSIDIRYADNKTAAERGYYSIPEDATLFIYGGNLGRPQGIEFFMDVLRYNQSRPHIFFLIVGAGTEFSNLNNFIKNNNIPNVLLLDAVPPDEFEALVAMSDVGLIFLDRRFTIPNFPSRLLSYLQNKKPVISATDQNTDIGRILTENSIGFWVESGDINGFSELIDQCVDNKENLKSMGICGYNYLIENYSTDVSYKTIMNHFS